MMGLPAGFALKRLVSAWTVIVGGVSFYCQLHLLARGVRKLQTGLMHARSSLGLALSGSHLQGLPWILGRGDGSTSTGELFQQPLLFMGRSYKLSRRFKISAVMLLAALPH